MTSKNPSRSHVRKNRKEKKKRSPFARFIKTFFIIIFVIALTLTAAVAVLYYTTDPKTLIDKISVELYKQYNRELSIRSIKVSLFKGIYLEGIELSERGGFSRGTAVEFKEGSVIYNPFALLHGQLDIIKISVGGFYSTYKKTIALVEDLTKNSGQEETSPSRLSFRLREIEIYDSQFLYANVPLNFEARVLPDIGNIFNTTLRIKVFSIYGELLFTGKVNDGQLLVSKLKTAPFTDHALDMTVNRLSVVLHLEDATHYSVLCRNLDVDYGSLHVESYSQFTGTYNTKMKEISLEGAGFRINGSKLFAESLSYAVQAKLFKAKLTNIEVLAGDLIPGARGTLSGDLSIEYARKLYLTGQLKVEDFAYEFIDAADAELRFADSAASGSIRVSTECGELTASLSSDNLAVSPLTVNLKSDSLVLDPLIRYLNRPGRSQPSREGSSGGGGGGFPLPEIRLVASVGKLQYERYTADSVCLSVSYTPSLISLKNLSFVFMKGTLTASGDLIDNVFSGRLTYDKGKLKEFSKLFLSEGENISGTVRIDGKFRLDMKDLYDSIVDVQVSVSDGVIENLILQDRISKLLYDIPLDYIIFDKIALNAILNERRLNLLSLTFDSDQIRLNANGTLTLDDQKLNADATLTIDKDYLSPLPNFARIFTSGYEQDGWVNFHLGIENTLREPKIKIIR